VLIARKTAIARTVARMNASLCALGAMISTSWRPISASLLWRNRRALCDAGHNLTE
jgi:hypothetical protein